MTKFNQTQDFILDGTNAASRLPCYNSFKDQHLTYFFANTKLQKHLRKVGNYVEKENPRVLNSIEWTKSL